VKITDVKTVVITDSMQRAATDEAMELAGITSGLRNAHGFGSKNHDYVGSIAHQAVERLFERYGMIYESSRGGKTSDEWDILYDGDKIDVKGTRGELSDKWFFNESFLIFQHQVDRGIIQKKDYLVFVKVGEEKAYIFGIIATDDFLQKAVDRKLKYDNKEIKAHQLKPFDRYVFRT
jgi:hypothetical protein